MQQFIYVLHLISWLTPLENISSWMFHSAKKSSSMPKLEDVQVVLSCSIWVLCQVSKQGARTPWVSPSISTQGVMGDGGHHEPTSEISSTIWRRCSHPGWLNALLNSFLNIPRLAIVWQRLHCMTTGKLYKILTSVSLPQLEQSQCSDSCPPALCWTHKSK